MPFVPTNSTNRMTSMASWHLIMNVNQEKKSASSLISRANSNSKRIMAVQVENLLVCKKREGGLNTDKAASINRTSLLVPVHYTLGTSDGFEYWVGFLLFVCLFPFDNKLPKFTVS